MYVNEVVFCKEIRKKKHGMDNTESIWMKIIIRRGNFEKAS